MTELKEGDHDRLEAMGETIIDAGMRRLAQANDELREVGQALARVGLTEMAQEIAAAQDNVLRAIGHFKEGRNMVSKARLARSSEEFVNLGHLALKSVLAGVASNKESEGK